MSDLPEGTVVVTREDLENMTYIDSEGIERAYPTMGQGKAVLADADDLARDELGFTNPNLHRRIELHEPTGHENPPEYAPREYSLDLCSVHSYRTTTITLHNEDSIDSEIP